MPGSFYMPMEIFNGIALTLFALVPIVFLVVTAHPEWGARRVAQMSMRARLPVGFPSTERSIRARTRALTRADMWGLLVAIAFVGSMSVLTPLGASPYFLWFFAIAIIFGVLTVSAAVVTTRERLFSPAPAAPRVARVQSLSIGDYIGRWRVWTPTALLAATGLLIVAVVVTVAVGAVAPDQLAWVGATAALAVAAFLTGRAAERRVLSQPQPASDTVELAWDDLFRKDALSTLRMAAAMAAWLPFGLCVAILLRAGLPFASSGWEATLGLFPWWGIPVLQVVYLLGQGRLPAALYPEFLRAPALAPEGEPA